MRSVLMQLFTLKEDVSAVEVLAIIHAVTKLGT